MNFEQADELNEAIRAIGIRHRALAIAALAPLGIHPGHKLILLELQRAGPRTQAQLAAASGYEPPTITASVPFSAPATPPLTGASTATMFFAFRPSATRLA